MRHIYPIGDEKEHDTESTGCHCDPIIDWEKSLVIHSAFDGRELIEQAEAIKKDAACS